MTSKIVVNNIEPDAGISTVSILGIATATKFIGDVEGGVTGNVTGNVTGSSGSCTGNAATATVASGITTTASVNTSGIVTATSFVPTVGQLSHRNLIINGACLVQQRSSSGSATNGYATVDRFQTANVGNDEMPTQGSFGVSPPGAFHLPTTGPHPYKEGFRKAFGVTNGNQTSGAGAGDVVAIRYSVEAQDIANSGWHYTDSSSFITLSFWVKSSAAQNFYGYLLTLDGTMQRYAFETGALTAFTWKKVVLKIPGNSNITIDDNNGEGFRIEWRPFSGTDETDSGVSLNTWGAFAGGTRTPDSPTTWYTTNDASFQITGLQLEVGSVATPFEHRSYGDELMRCMRYYETNNHTTYAKNTDGSITSYWSTITSNDSNTLVVSTGIVYKVGKRASPTVTIYNSSNTGTANRVNAQGTERTVTATYGGPNALTRIYVSGASSGNYVTYNWEASAEL